MQQQGTICGFNGDESWVVLSPIEQSIKRKIEAVGTPLKDWDIRINYGIKTGCNEAFIITTEKRDEILSNCKSEVEREKTAELIRPILRGRDIKRYSYNWAGLWLINTHNGVRGSIPRIDIENYPAIKQYLDNYWDELSRRADKGDTPYNLRNCAYLEDFFQPKMIWKRIGSLLRFSYDRGSTLGLDSTCFAIGNRIPYLCCLLNSKMGNYLLKDAPKTGTGDLIISVQAIEPVLAAYSEEVEASLVELLEKYINNRDQHIENKMDDIIFSLYGLTDEEKAFVSKTIELFR